ncbi:pirin family protein [Methylomicrobium sp. RS1]|jgi:redox-sensitive bicupin YhaK (pirin superfamily)|uniref:pirin family protein n=1 Tax=Candidatus Methylomicrobium oryzae TaxID=2802053 RepID=UPI001924EA82|nr:pirin family protein [Methylomicrobium sp. RS1]MBL1264834.1 pirin family protein [Methylomicrobium sp. RS1]
MKPLYRIVHEGQFHWVGDGFPVRTLFSYATPDAEVSPFLLLDYAGPAEFPPASRPRGVGFHPHRGFETVTILYQGAVEHRDTAGNGGLIGPGDVQWMTAAKGLRHEEMHSAAFTRQGGTFEAIQLWVNLPAKYKQVDPHYQAIAKAQIPEVRLDEKGSMIRVIAGSYQGIKGPADTYTPVNLWDIRLSAGQNLALSLPENYTTLLLALHGRVEINRDAMLNEAELAFFESRGDRIELNAVTDSMLLVMNGEPIDEPIAGYGPFVMNTQEEIRQAMADFNYR